MVRAERGRDRGVKISSVYRVSVGHGQVLEPKVHKGTKNFTTAEHGEHVHTGISGSCSYQGQTLRFEDSRGTH